MNDLIARIDATVEMLLNREAQHVTALFPDQSCALRALLVEARAQLAAQAEALAAYRGALTKWADLGTNYRHAITDEMLGQLFSLTDTTTQAHGCEVCAEMTADDGTICCWTCGRVIPDSLLGAQS